MTIDNEYIKELQHELHRIPELGFDLPRTVAVVKRELDKIGIEYTEKYGKCSIVADLNPEKSDFIPVSAAHPGWKAQYRWPESCSCGASVHPQQPPVHCRTARP